MEKNIDTPKPESGICICPAPEGALARLNLPPGFSYMVDGLEVSLPCGLCLIITQTGETQLSSEQVKQLFQSYLSDVMKAFDPSRFIYAGSLLNNNLGPQKDSLTRSNVLPHYK